MPRMIARLSKTFKEGLNRLTKLLGVSGIEFVEKVLKRPVERRKRLKTRQMRGSVKSMLSLEDLELIYQAIR